MNTVNIEKNHKPSISQVEHHDFLHAEILRLLKQDFHSVSKEVYKLGEELQTLVVNYDWDNEEFEADGKKGLKNVKGEVVVPAIYDGFCYRGSYLFPSEYAVAKKADKVGIVACNGKGTPHSAFEFSYIQTIPCLTEVHIACKGDDRKHFAFLVGGKEFTPYELTKLWEPCNGYLVAGNEDGKCGALILDGYGFGYLPPEYDNIYDEGIGSYITFVKDGKEGLLTYDGRFISKEDFEKLDEAGKDEYLYVGFYSVD